ncbi:MAG: DNA adenine methylase [Pseudomonadota bacterium]
MLKPFLKWAGGKRQLLPELEKRLPENIQRYYEPFIGAGALLLHLQPKNAVIGDTNVELLNCYRTIRDDVNALIEKLTEYQGQNNPDAFYTTRALDRDSETYGKLANVERAARIIYLNKTCFNGLFRVNSKGHFNVPFGRYKNPTILEGSVLNAVSTYLNTACVDIRLSDFETTIADAGEGDFIYFDPPYDPISETAHFTSYAAGGFGRDAQIRLKETMDALSNKGCRVLLSNAQTPFIEDLYKEYCVESVQAARHINSNASKRGKIGEVMVRNY